MANYIKWKIVEGTTNQYGLLDTGITTNNGVIIYAGNLNGDNGYVGIPYRIQQVNSNQMIYVLNAATGNRVINTSVKFVVFLLKYDTQQDT